MMCELFCIGTVCMFPLALLIVILEPKKVKGYCIKGSQHDWDKWDVYLEGKSRTCKKCGLTEHEDN